MVGGGGLEKVAAMPAVSESLGPAAGVEVLESPAQFAEPDAAPPTFAAVVKKDSAEESVGWQVDIVDNKHLFLCRILEGPSSLQSYNKSVPEDKQLKVGDYIVKVNGGNESVHAMMAASRSSSELHFIVQRPRIFQATVNKDGGSLGLALTHAKGCPSLCIEDIKEGAVRKHAPEVVVGDRITGVNGIRGDSDTLMAAIQRDSLLELEFSRAG